MSNANIDKLNYVILSGVAFLALCCLPWLLIKIKENN